MKIRHLTEPKKLLVSCLRQLASIKNIFDLRLKLFPGLPFSIPCQTWHYITSGCGSGSSTRPFAPHFGKVVGVDYSPTQINLATELATELPNTEYHLVFIYLRLFSFTNPSAQ